MRTIFMVAVFWGSVVAAAWAAAHDHIWGVAAAAATCLAATIWVVRS